MQIAFVSSCLPRKCGIATFSAHLSQALEKNVANNPLERQILAERAYALGCQMGWSSVSRQYLEVFADVMELEGKESSE